MLIVGSASLVASVLVWMARVVDRARSLALIAHEGSWEQRARYTERSIALLYAAVVVFVATALSIALDRATGNALEWLPVFLAIAGTVLLLGGGMWMVAESRLSADQIQDEIGQTLSRLEVGGTSQ